MRQIREKANNDKDVLTQSRVSQPQHYWHFGPDNSLLWGNVLYAAECSAAVLPSIYQLPVVPPFSCENIMCF